MPYSGSSWWQHIMESCCILSAPKSATVYNIIGAQSYFHCFRLMNKEHRQTQYINHTLGFYNVIREMKQHVTIEKIIITIQKNNKSIRIKWCHGTWFEKCFPGVQITLLAHATQKKKEDGRSRQHHSHVVNGNSISRKHCHINLTPLIWILLVLQCVSNQCTYLGLTIE